MKRWLTKTIVSASVRASPRSSIAASVPALWSFGSVSPCSLISTCRSLSVRGGEQQYTVLSEPAPGSPFHYAFPVHDLQAAKQFYGDVLGCQEGRSSEKWQDYSLHGHQIVAHWAGNDYRCQDYYNPVDGDEVPVPRTYCIDMPVWRRIVQLNYAIGNTYLSHCIRFDRRHGTCLDSRSISRVGGSAAQGGCQVHH